MNDATRERGLANIRQIRARMHGHGAPSVDHRDNEPDAEPVVRGAETSTPVGSRELDDAQALVAAMAAGAERDRLERRISDLEAEVRHLRAALARVLREVSTAIDPLVNHRDER
jgi:hypothetical protein